MRVYAQFGNILTMKIGAFLGAIIIPIWDWYAPGAVQPPPDATVLIMLSILGAALGALAGIGFSNLR